MLRFFLTVLVGLGIFGGIAWVTGMLQPADTSDKTTAESKDEETPAEKNFGPRLYTGPELKDETPLHASAGVDPTVFANFHTSVIDEGDVPCRNDGKLLFIGTEVKQGEDGYDPNVFAPVFRWGKWENIYYRPLKDNDPLRENQMVGLIDPILAYNQVEVRKAKVEAARSDHEGAKALQKVYQGELKRFDAILAKDSRAVSDSEYAVAKAQAKKYEAEALSKNSAINVAEKELAEADTLLKLHTLKNTVRPSNGAVYNPRLIRIKTVFKHQNEAVKAQEAILHVHNIGWLRAEGLIDPQYRGGLEEGMTVQVEPTRVRKPLRTFTGHREAITSVAVSSDDRNPSDPYLVTGSDDQTARVWKRSLKNEFASLPHLSAVKSVACSSFKARGRWCLTGCADGSIRLWDLGKLSDPKFRAAPTPEWVKEDRHTDVVNCLAFSPDGKLFLSGGDDNAIYLADTDTGKRKYRFDEEKGHQGAVTSLHFTPDLQVVSAGRDNTIRLWTLHENGAKQHEKRELANRSGNVTNFGLDPDGKWMVFDRGNTLQVISRLSGRKVGMVQDPAQSSPFETLAAFSPVLEPKRDAPLILTASASEGRLQLWTAPIDGSRSIEVRQFKLKEGGVVSCAAFGIDKTLASSNAVDAERVFAVTGTRDGLLYMWAVPGKAQVDKKIVGTISLKDPFKDPSTGQSRLWVNVDNRERELAPGDTVAIVVEALQQGKRQPR